MSLDHVGEVQVGGSVAPPSTAASRAWTIARAGVRRWQSFWFTPAPASVLTAIRIAIGLCALAWAASILPDLETFWFDDGLLPDATYGDHRLALFQWLDGDAWVVAVYVTMVVASVAVIAGRVVRLAAPLLWITMVTMQLAATTALNAGDLLLRVWTTYFALYAVLTPSRFLSVPLFGHREPDGSRSWPAAPGWFIRLAQVQLSVIYPATVIAKLDGDTWREGTAALWALGLTDFERFWVPDVVRENLLLGSLMTWFTIAVEFSVVFLLWTRRTRWAGIVLGVGMHAGFDYTMRLGFFLPTIVIGYLAFVRHDELARFLDRVGRFRPAGGARAIVNDVVS